MTTRNVVFLAILAFAALLLAIWLGSSRQTPTPVFTEQPLFPELVDKVNDVTALQVQGGGGEQLLRLERQDQGWVVANRDGYPAHLPKVRETLLALARSTLLEEKTANPDWYARLGVEDVLDNQAAGGVLLSLEMDASSKSLIVGNYDGQGGQGTFVRRPEERGSWLASGNLVPDQGISAWLERDLMDISASRIRAVHIEHPDGEVISAVKDSPEDSNYRIANLPENREPASNFVANALAGVPANLRLENVISAERADRDPDAAINVRYETFDGLVISVQAWPESPGQARLRASLDEAGAEQVIDAELAAAGHELAEQQAQLGEELAAAEEAGDEELADTLRQALADVLESQGAFEEGSANDKAERLQALREEAATIHARVDGWVFELPAFKFQNIDKRMDSLLKPLESDEG